MARTRSAAAHRKVLETALQLFATRGIDATSMDAIADASGVSKATIYKHWRDKDGLCMEVLGYLHGLDEEPVQFNTGNLRTDLIDLLNYQPTPERRAMKERIMPHFIAYSARNREFGKQWRTRILERPRSQLRQMMKQAILQRRLVKKLDPEVGIALLLGPMLYRHIFLNHTEIKPPDDLAEKVVDAFLAAFQAVLKTPASSVRKAH